MVPNKTYLWREEADQIVEKVDAESICDDEKRSEQIDSQDIHADHEEEKAPSVRRVRRDPVKNLLPFSVVQFRSR